MKKRSGQIWLGILFLIFGVLFLLKNFGFITESVWSIVGRFWPLILVLIGLEMIVKDKVARGIIAVIFLLIFLLLIIFPPRGTKRVHRFGRDIVKSETVLDSSSTFVLNEDLKGVESIEIKVDKIKRLDIYVKEGLDNKMESQMFISGKKGEFFPDSIEYNFSRLGKKGILTIRDKRSVAETVRGFWSEKGYEGKLELRIPKGLSLAIENVNGDVEIEGLKMKDVEINLVNGDLKLKDFDFNNFELSLVNGDVEAERLVAKENIEFSLVNGDFEIDEAIGKVLKVSGINGSLKLGEKTEFDMVKVDLVNGDIVCTITPTWLRGVVNLKTVSGDVELKKMGVDKLPLRIKKGLKEEGEEPSKAKIFVETVTGSIVVE
jgi:hypothetical protein